jgi:hypothetical protein
LVASKAFMAKTREEEEEEKEAERPYSSAPPTCHSSPASEDESLSNSNIIDLDSSSDSSSLSSTPSSSISEDEDHEILSTAPQHRNTGDFIHRRIINQKLSDISGLYTVNEVNQMERGFMKRLGNNSWVTEKDIKDYVENNKHALGIC